MKLNLVKLKILTLILVPLLLPQAASAATLYFAPSSGQLITGCRQSVDLMLNATGQSTNAANVEFNYNPSQITMLDQNTAIAGTQILTGNAYGSYVFQDVNPATGLIRMVAGGIGAANNGIGTYASLRFTNNPGVTSTTITISYAGAGNTYDSNIADTNTSNDLLTGVTNVTYTFVDGICPENDNTPPTVTNVDPQNNSTNIPLDSSITFDITDDVSGVDIESLIVYVNGNPFTINDPELTYTGSGNSYSVTLNPSADFPTDTTINIFIVVRDNNGNIGSAQIVYNNQGVPVTSASSSLNTSSTTSTPAVIPPGSPLYIIDQIFTTPGNLLDNTPLKDTFIDRALGDLGITGTGALITGVILGANILPLLTLLNAPGLLFNIMSFYLGKKHRRPWGVVIDAHTGKPIPFATCRIYVGGSTTMLTQTVSDTEGRYGFVINAGKYRLEVSQGGYQTFSVEIELGEGETGYVYDVKLLSNELNSQTYRVQSQSGRKLLHNLGKAFEALRRWLFVFGFALSIVSIILLPNVINWIVFGLYIITFLIWTLARFVHRTKYASVVDSESQLRLPYAVIKIFDLKTWQLIDTQMTNSAGFFDFWGEAGEYAILVTLRGYNFPSKNQPGLEVITEKYSSMVKANLSSGGNKLVLYVDPVSTTSSNVATGNIPNPFRA